MGRSAAALLLPFAMVGCISGSGVLDSSEALSADAARISAPPETLIRISPLHHPDRAVELPRAESIDIRVAPGWYRVAFSCDVQPEALVIREYVTERNIWARPGHRYRLTCHPKHLGVLQMQELGLAPNNSFKPKPLRGSA